jgi:DNA-binding MarR family transcriptional regulator
MEGWVSPRLGVRFNLEGADLIITRPDGRRFETFVELTARAEAEHQRAKCLAERLRALGVDPAEL